MAVFCKTDFEFKEISFELTARQYNHLAICFFCKKDFWTKEGYWVKYKLKTESIYAYSVCCSNTCFNLWYLSEN